MRSKKRIASAKKEGARQAHPLLTIIKWYPVQNYLAITNRFTTTSFSISTLTK